MPQIVGMDEAGYGPNLGPLVISAAVWRFSANNADCDLWTLLSDVFSQSADTEGCLHVGDSKQVYSPAKGLASLELSVLTILSVAGVEIDTFQSLWAQLAITFPEHGDQEPWFAVTDFKLPIAAEADQIQTMTDRLERSLAEKGVSPPRIVSDVVLTERFNRSTRQHQSKGRMLSCTSLDLLRQVWDPASTDPTIVICDKHGGRNRYDELLAEITDGAMIFRMRESRQCSTYRIGTSEVRFQTKAESHLPVAVASMVSKYLRELAMWSFNAYWQQQVPQLRPTRGYPMDAKRFRRDIAVRQSELGIKDDVLWRHR